jgi:serine/threonine-protein kinase RsbT
MLTDEQELRRVSLESFEDIVTARQSVLQLMAEMGFNLLDQTRMVTAVSELARNVVVHSGVGQMRIVTAAEMGEGTHGIRCLFEDNGPGIPDIERAMRAGINSTESVGLGLAGARDLSDVFTINSVPGHGTRVSITKWR